MIKINQKLKILTSDIFNLKCFYKKINPTGSKSKLRIKNYTKNGYFIYKKKTNVICGI